MILVTGSTGLLGNTIVRQLLSEGRAVRAFVRPTSELTPLAGLGVEILKGSLTSVADVRHAVQGCEAVIHCAAMIHLGRTKLHEAREANVSTTKLLANERSRTGARMVFVSTVNALDAAHSLEMPLNERENGVKMTPCTYVITKREAEAVICSLASCMQLDFIIVRRGFMLGPHDWKPSSGRMFRSVVRSPIVAAPLGACSVCHTRDVAEHRTGAIPDKFEDVTGQRGDERPKGKIRSK